MTRPNDVRLRHRARALILCSCFAFSGLATSLLPSGALARDPEVDVNACVNYDEVEVDADTFKVKLDSSCEATLKCKVSWSLACEAGAPARAEARSFNLRAGASKSVQVSAKHCGDKLWELDNLTWSCVQR